MQTCKQCLMEKPLTEFFKNSVKANGHDSKCKECRKASAKSYREKNADDISTKRKATYAENRELILAKKQAYYQENASRLLAQKSEYWAKNKDAIHERTEKWRSENKGLLALRAKQNRQAVIDSVILMLGGRCSLCGIVESEFLTIDHIDNDGNSERKMGSIGWKRKILTGSSDPKRYRVLCHNCNLSKYRMDPVHHVKKSMDTGAVRVCPSCKIEKDESMFHRGHTRKCLECSRLSRMERRKQMVEELGGSCKCCGENEWSKLVVDHVNNDGNLARQAGVYRGIDIMSAILRGKLKRSDHQLLCWNCNHSKHRGSGLCVHQRNGSSLIRGVTPTVRNTIVQLSKSVDFELEDISVGPAKLEDVKGFFDAHHYAGFGRPSSCVFHAKLGGEVIAAAKFAPPVRQGIAPSLGLQDSQVLELDRFCIHPAYHKKNFATWFMSRTIKWVSSERPEILKLVSFADPRFGHAGTIYKASNWQEVGKTSRSYYYEDQDGKEINKKTLYEFARQRGMKERQCVEALGYKKVHTPPKIKYVYNIR